MYICEVVQEPLGISSLHNSYKRIFYGMVVRKSSKYRNSLKKSSKNYVKIVAE